MTKGSKQITKKTKYNLQFLKPQLNMEPQTVKNRSSSRGRKSPYREATVLIQWVE